MNRRNVLTLTAMALLCVGVSFSAFAQQGQLGTPQEARAMLDKAVAAVKADRDLALAMFNKGEGGFRDRDLCVDVYQPDDPALGASSSQRQILGISRRDVQ